MSPIILIKVDLPHPDGPCMILKEHSLKEQFILDSACITLSLFL